MRIFLSIILLSLVSANISYSQNAYGIWEGKFDETMSFYLDIVKSDSGSCSVFLDVPSQGVERLEDSTCEIRKDSIYTSFQIPFSSKYAKVELAIIADSLKGSWKQGGTTPITLSRAEEVKKLERPQTPKPPYSYVSEEISFINKRDSIILQGALTSPDEDINSTAVVLIAGSGPQNRNSTFFKHKPFLVLADHLSSNDITVLRFDERGIGKSQGVHSMANSMDFAHDVKSAVEFLRERGYKKVGLIGHSEGGMIAQLCYSLEVQIDFIVSMAGPGIPIKQLMTIQNEMAIDKIIPKEEIPAYLEFINKSYDILDPEEDVQNLYEPLKKVIDSYYDSVADKEFSKSLAPSKEAFYINLSSAYLGRWFRYFINYEPEKYIQKIKSPILVLNGTKDVQVTADKNLTGYEAGLIKAGNQNFQIMKLPDLNHLFQKAETGEVSEYALIEETINDSVLIIISEWINKL